MRDYYKIRVLTGYSLICLWFLIKLCFSLFNLYFTKESYEHNFNLALLIILIFGGVFLMTFGIWKKAKLAVSFNIIVVFCIVLLIRSYVIIPFSKMCGEIIDDTVYVNQNDNRVLYSIDFNCGAWDSDQPNTIITEKIILNQYFYKTKFYSEEELDLNIWKKESIKLHNWSNK